MDKFVMRLLFVTILSALLIGFGVSCEEYPTIDYEIPEYNGDLKNGDIRDEYVYYDGTWYYHGIGCPYIWEE